MIYIQIEYFEEEWRDIEGFIGYYQVSNYGRVRGLDRYIKVDKQGDLTLHKGRIMKLTKRIGRPNEKTSYVVVNLRKNGKSYVRPVHRLVAKAFLDNPLNLPTVNHKDGDKGNNLVTNLEWASYSDNNKHALETNLRQPRGIPIAQFNLNHILIQTYRSASEASRITGLDRGSICHCLRHRRDSYAGFIWEYIDH